jgi:hypothetical protein
MFPRGDALPQSTKTASVLTQADQDLLPDDVFALVTQGEGQTLRKFACFDGGNTELSIHYFLKNAYKLPEEAQAQVAQNLKVACAWYAIEVPTELDEIATGNIAKVGGIVGALGRHAAANPLGTAVRVATVPSIVTGVPNEIKRNVAATRAAQEATGISAVTPEQVAHFKGAEVVGTSDMPLQPPGSKEQKSIAVVKKTGAAQKMNIYEAGRDEKGKPDTNDATKGKAPNVAPKMNPHIDVTGKTASLEIPQYHENYALGNRYPIDSYAQVKMAEAYFTENRSHFLPVERHEYCMNLTERAASLDIDLDKDIRKYGSSQYAPADEIDIALTMRRNLLLQNDPAREILDKLAEARPSLPPKAFAEALEEFDKVAELNHQWDYFVYDPYFSTYGTSEKTASEKVDEFVDTIGNARVTGKQLKDVSHTKSLQIKDIFGCDFSDEFRKDPVSIYDSMPREQKLMLINLANDNAPGVRGSFE